MNDLIAIKKLAEWERLKAGTRDPGRLGIM